MAFDEGFLARWSRRKAESHLPSGSVDPTRDPTPDLNTPERSSDEPATGLDCASLEFSSDFSRFVCDGISTTMQTAALRRLWLTSPLFNTSDGLDVYRADYTRASPLGDVPQAASRALQMIAGEQSTTDRPGPPLAVTSNSHNDIAPCLEEEESQPAPAQEPQSNE